MHSPTTLAMLGAMGVTVYRTTRQTPALEAPHVKPKTPVPTQHLRPDPVLEPAHATLPTPVVAARVQTVAKRPASLQRELVLPQAELKRFSESRMYKHLCLLFAAGESLAVVENAVLSDTALHYESPPENPVKLGSMALLKTNWRKRREAWLAIRLWRKQLKKRV